MLTAPTSKFWAVIKQRNAPKL